MNSTAFDLPYPTLWSVRVSVVDWSSRPANHGDAFKTNEDAEETSAENFVPDFGDENRNANDEENTEKFGISLGTNKWKNEMKERISLNTDSFENTGVKQSLRNISAMDSNEEDGEKMDVVPKTVPNANFKKQENKARKKSTIENKDEKISVSENEKLVSDSPESAAEGRAESFESTMKVSPAFLTLDIGVEKIFVHERFRQYQHDIGELNHVMDASEERMNILKN